MKKLLPLLATLLISTAAAQQKPTFAPVTIDGVTTQNGLVTVNGKTYVSLDALKARRVTVLGPSTLGIYTFPAAKGVTTKLSGCMNEWLNDGTTRVRVKSQGLDSMWQYWNIYIDAQSTENTRFSRVFPEKSVYAVFKSGKVFDTAADQFLSTLDTINDLENKTMDSGAIALKMPDLTADDAVTKLVLRSANGGTWTFDLTCKK